MLGVEDELVVGALRPGRYAVAVGDRAIGFVHGNDDDGYAAEGTDGARVPGRHLTIEAAAWALLAHHAGTFRPGT